MKEIRSSRLAMLSKFGYYVQPAVTTQGPVENWASHIADPFAVTRLTLETTTQSTPSVAMFATAGKKQEAAPKVDLSGWYGLDRNKWLGPNIADSYVFDYVSGEYPGDYGWDSARPAAGPKSYGPARGLRHHLQSRLVPMLAALFLGCCSAAPLGILLACCSVAALPCLAPYPGEQTDQRPSPLLMLMLCSSHCPQSLVGRYPRSSGSSVTLWATSGSPGTHGIEQGRKHLSVRDAR